MISPSLVQTLIHLAAMETPRSLPVPGLGAGMCPMLSVRPEVRSAAGGVRAGEGWQDRVLKGAFSLLLRKLERNDYITPHPFFPHCFVWVQWLEEQLYCQHP